jgi:hypothetical protein
VPHLRRSLIAAQVGGVNLTQRIPKLFHVEQFGFRSEPAAVPEMFQRQLSPAAKEKSAIPFHHFHQRPQGKSPTA